MAIRCREPLNTAPRFWAVTDALKIVQALPSAIWAEGQRVVGGSSVALMSRFDGEGTGTFSGQCGDCPSAGLPAQTPGSLRWAWQGRGPQGVTRGEIEGPGQTQDGLDSCFAMSAWALWQGRGPCAVHTPSVPALDSVAGGWPGSRPGRGQLPEEVRWGQSGISHPAAPAPWLWPSDNRMEQPQGQVVVGQEPCGAGTL